jgi:alpha-D-ribose 1-methylphosphonate 5-triphosphate synthase subunit PhnG
MQLVPLTHSHGYTAVCDALLQQAQAEETKQQAEIEAGLQRAATDQTSRCVTILTHLVENKSDTSHTAATICS